VAAGLCDGVPRLFVGRLIAIAAPPLMPHARAYSGRDDSASHDSMDIAPPSLYFRIGTQPIFDSKQGETSPRPENLVPDDRYLARNSFVQGAQINRAAVDG
jgi:hypothetical protein